MAQIVVTSSSPLPRFRAGVEIKGAMPFPADKFTAAQLRELIADPVLTVVVGDVMAPADVDGFLAKVAKAAAAKAPKGE